MMATPIGGQGRIVARASVTGRWSALKFAFGPNVTQVPLSDVLFFQQKLERWLKSCDARRFGEYENLLVVGLRGGREPLRGLP